MALLVRLPKLDERPMHTDEAGHAYITGQLLAGENYQYDPQDRHGPALYLAAVPIAESAGANNLAELNETTVRLVPVVFSVLLVLLLAAAATQIGFVAALFAALLFAIAPLPVFYGRYFIHEILFVVGTLAFGLSAWRTLETKSWRAALVAGASAGFMLACKETALIHFVAFLFPLAWWIRTRHLDVTRRSSSWKAMRKPVAFSFLAFIAVVLVLYTWGGQHWNGPVDLLRSLPRFAQRAGGEGHEKPFWYYLRLLCGSGAGAGLFLFALPALAKSIRLMAGENIIRSGNSPDANGLVLQHLTLYTIAIVSAYSIIRYKNPWLGLNLWLPLALLAGAGFQLLWFKSARLPVRLTLLFVAAGLVSGSAFETRKWVFKRSSDEWNPYAYAHTVEDILGLPEQITKFAAETRNSDPTIAVIAADPWPLPWYLRRFQHVGYYQLSQTPAPADFYITTPAAAERMAGALDGWRPGFFGVRPEVLVLLWNKPANE